MTLPDSSGQVQPGGTTGGAMKTSRRELLTCAALAPLAVAAPAAAQAGRTFTPEQFGAVGDGRTNDTEAFVRMSAAVAAAGGGEVVLARRTYIVGRQRHLPAERTRYVFEPSPIMEFVGLRGPLVIRGNGAKLRCAPGLRYGAFTRAGRPARNPMPYYGHDLASPYYSMIKIANCSGSVEVSDLELDGAIGELEIGGRYGDTGWQIGTNGLSLINNRGSERVLRVYSHHHAQDGILIDGLDASRGAGVNSLLQDVRCEFNARQGVSLVGGRSYRFERCKFSGSGKARIASAPGAGVDIEAEQSKRVRDVSFSDCEFSNNHGCSFLAAEGDIERVTLTDCRLNGTTLWAAWPNKPYTSFTRCLFVGAIVNAHGDPVAERATKFIDCTFRDDPALSPTGEVYGAPNTDRPIVDLYDHENVLFRNCRFLLTHRSALPWTRNVTYQDCTFSQRSSAPSYPRGYFIGRNVMAGPAVINGSWVRGELILNGRLIPRGQVP
jgi:hypothetical protein